MSEINRARRRFLTSTALGTALGGLGLLAGAQAAKALTLQPMNAETHKLYADRCSLANDGYHQALAAAEREKRAGTMSEDEINAVLAQMRCPICNCPVMAAATPQTSTPPAG